MESPKQTYNKSKGNSRTRTEASQLFYKKYVLHQTDPDPFKLNERSRYKFGDPTFFMPGKIYTFTYDPLNKDILEFYNKRPVILCHDVYKAKTGNTIVEGLNLNFLPEQMKANVLDLHYNTFKKDIQLSEDIAGYSRFTLKATRFMYFLKNWLQGIKLFESKNINYNFAYRQYIIPRMKNAALIEYDDWNIIPLLNVQSKELIGITLPQLYKRYFDSLREFKEDKHKIK